MYKFVNLKNFAKLLTETFRPERLMAVIIKISVVWDVLLCIWYRFTSVLETCCLVLQGRNIGISIPPDYAS